MLNIFLVKIRNLIQNGKSCKIRYCKNLKQRFKLYSIISVKVGFEKNINYVWKY